MGGNPARHRVLMLITNLGQGGAERVFHDHATAFAASGLVVEQAVFAGDYQDAYQTALPLHLLGVSPWLAWLGPVGRLLGRSLALRRLVANGAFDVVVSHMDGANWVNALSGARAAKVLVVHGSVMHDRNQRGWRQWLRTRVIIPALYRRAQAVVAVSSGIRDELLALGVPTVVSLPNFFDVATIRRAARSPVPGAWQDLFASGPVLVSSGRLSPQKNQLELLWLFAQVRARHPSVRLLVLGDGERRAALLAACRVLGLRAYHPWEDDQGTSVPIAGADVVFGGYQGNPFAFVARSTLFLFPSLWEGFPLALCEAMICGVPVLSSDCPTGPREILAPGADTQTRDDDTAEFTGCGVLLPLLCDERAREVWCDTISVLMGDPARMREIAQAGARAAERLDRPRVLAQWLSLLDRVVASRHG